MIGYLEVNLKFISGVRRDVEICTLLGYYAASRGNCLSTFRDNVSGPSSRVKSPRRYQIRGYSYNESSKILRNICSNLHCAVFKKTENFARMIQSRVRWVRHAAYKQGRESWVLQSGEFLGQLSKLSTFEGNPSLELAYSTATEIRQQRIVTQPRRGSPERGEVLQLCTPGPPAERCAWCWMVQMQLSV
jgi:hypothetical protein